MVLLLGLLVVSILGLSLGFRFFKGYYFKRYSSGWLVRPRAFKIVYLKHDLAETLHNRCFRTLDRHAICREDYKALMSIRQMRTQPEIYPPNGLQR